MLLTLFGTPFFVSLGFAGLVHILHKRCAAHGVRDGTWHACARNHGMRKHGLLVP